MVAELAAFFFLGTKNGDFADEDHYCSFFAVNPNFSFAQEPGRIRILFPQAISPLASPPTKHPQFIHKIFNFFPQSFPPTWLEGP